MKKTLSVMFYAMFICYIVVMLQLLFRLNAIPEIDIYAARSVNLIPFYTIWNYLSKTVCVSTAIVLYNVLGNIVIFIPYGLYIQVLRKDKRFHISLLQVAVTPFIVEAVQFAFNLGSADIDDVILNCLGGVIGILLYKLLFKLAKGEEKTKNIMTVLSFVVGIPIVIAALILFPQFIIHPR